MCRVVALPLEELRIEVGCTITGAGNEGGQIRCCKTQETTCWVNGAIVLERLRTVGSTDASRPLRVVRNQNTPVTLDGAATTTTNGGIRFAKD